MHVDGRQARGWDEGLDDRTSEISFRDNATNLQIQKHVYIGIWE